MVIDLNAETPTRAKQAIGAVQAERLSPQAPQNGDAIVRSHGNANHETPAETTGVNNDSESRRKLLITKAISPTTGFSRRNSLRVKDLAVSRQYYVYALHDPRDPTEAVRCVGYCHDPKRRLYYHTYEGKTSKKRSHRINWVRSLLNAGAKLVMKILATFETEEDAAKAEIETIADYRAKGYALVNGSEGGEGGLRGYGGKLIERRAWTPEERSRHSDRLRRPETRAKMSASAKARPPSRLGQPGKSPSAETRAKLSAALKGRPKTAEHAAKVGAAHKGRPKSAETRAKISATKTGSSPISIEMREQISRKMTGVKKSPETRERMHLAQQKRFEAKRQAAILATVAPEWRADVAAMEIVSPIP